MQKKEKYWLEKINSLVKLLICLAIGIIAYLIADRESLDTLTRIMIGWNVFSLCMIAITWITFGITDSGEIRTQVSIQDPKRFVVFTLVLIATIASVCAVSLMVIAKNHQNNQPNWRIPVAIVGMVLSWILIHTIFTLRYAHIYYGNDIDNPTSHAGGLQFPGDKRPEYYDFAYFSFVLGMTFQVSDVSVTSKSFRKLILFHSLISFAYNTIMIALVINLTA